jgi:hypothetical protein
MGAAGQKGQPFWDGRSWDCPSCGVGSLLSAFGPLEYLHNGTGGFASFGFDDADLALTELYSITAWTNGSLTRQSDGAFAYDGGTGHQSNSLDQGWQFALFRQVGVTSTQYFLEVEDIRFDRQRSDQDYNDFVVTF